MAGRVLSIEIGYALTKICEMDYKSKNPKIYKAFQLDTPGGVLNDGELNVTDEFTQQFRKSLSEHRIRTKQVIFTIMSTKIASREVLIPFVKENRISDVVNANAEDYFPVDMAQYRIAYSVLGVEEPEGREKQYKLQVLAAPTALLQKYYDFAFACGLTVANLDYAGNSLFQIVKYEREPETTQLVIKVDERNTLLMVIHNESIVFTRAVAYGIEEAVQTMVESVVWDDVSAFDAALEVFRRQKCITGSLDEDKQVFVSEERMVQEAVREVTASFVPVINGVARVIDFYNSRNAGAQIEKITLTGMGGDFAGLDDLLSNEIGADVRVLRGIEGWNPGKALRDGSLGEYISCIGASIAPLTFREAVGAQSGGVKRVYSKKKGLDLRYFSLGVLITGCVAAAALTAASVIPFAIVRNRNAALKNRVEELRPVLSVYQDYKNAEAGYNKIEYFDNSTQNNNVGLVEFMNEMERRMPSSINIRDFTSTTEGISITMSVAAPEAAAKAVSEFRKFDTLSGVSTNSITKEESEIGELSYIFTLTASYVSKDALAEAENGGETDAGGEAENGGETDAGDERIE